MKLNELLLCGSGVPAFAHIGVLLALEERDVEIESITGCSTGSLIATLHANHLRPCQIRRLFLNREMDRFNPDIWLGSPRGIRPGNGITNDLTAAARQFVNEFNLVPTTSLRLICWDICRDESFTFQGVRYDLSRALAASMSKPGLFLPVRMEQRVLVDIASRPWRLPRMCHGRGLISRAHADAELDSLSRVDTWLRQRQTLMPADDPCANSSRRRVVIDTHVDIDPARFKSARLFRSAVIQTGYESTVAALDAEAQRMQPIPSIEMST